MTNPRAAAFLVLKNYFSRSGKIELKQLTDKFLQSKNVPFPERGFIRDLVYGVVRYKLTLDWILKQFSQRKIEKISLPLITLLRLGIYQVFIAESIPDYAAVNETTELAKKNFHPGVASFVNGILRNLIRNKDKIVWPEDSLQFISVKYSYPQWLVKRWLSRYGPTEAEKIAQANNIPPNLIARTNTLKISRDELIQKLNQEGLKVSPTVYSPEGIIFDNSPSLSDLPSFKQGWFIVQEESSQLISHMVAPQPGELILDACAGPGGKTTHLAQLMKNTGKIMAVDSSKERLKKIKENIERLGVENVELVWGDIVKIAQKTGTKFDKILVDAPCSSLGILRRAVDVRWNKEEADLDKFSQTQQKILSAVAPLLKKGGSLVYSVCTNEPEETTGVVEKFLADHPGWEKRNERSDLDGFYGCLLSCLK